jgi:hypothetical protein
MPPFSPRSGTAIVFIAAICCFFGGVSGLYSFCCIYMINDLLITGEVDYAQLLIKLFYVSSI